MRSSEYGCPDPYTSITHTAGREGRQTDVSTTASSTTRHQTFAKPSITGENTRPQPVDSALLSTENNCRGSRDLASAGLSVASITGENTRPQPVDSALLSTENISIVGGAETWPVSG
ncbi:hypothetical protein RRG08_027929 [Elysia crispata]|uniref:Uncharacterized protein n=1 Tax=Elysia crispata TaxID=231223 RepID=A0AAE0Y920_9GAST|nr:hypothetical protein RRG08_027929 [Elysia crispata]